MHVKANAVGTLSALRGLRSPVFAAEQGEERKRPGMVSACHGVDGVVEMLGKNGFRNDGMTALGLLKGSLETSMVAGSEGGCRECDIGQRVAACATSNCDNLDIVRPR